MRHYVTHQFANAETLDRAERWLRQYGFGPEQIETHRTGVPWLSVLVASERSDEVGSIISAAERTDPAGWPSFWELARIPREQARDAPPARAVEYATSRAPIGWHPLEDDRGPSRAEDLGVFVRFA